MYLIDGNGFCYRAYHAVRDLRTSKGAPTNVAFGFTMMLKKLVDEYRPDGLAVAFDTKGPTFRHKKFEAYKSHRKPMPDDLVVQMPVVKRLCDAFRIPRYEKEGYEADDLIGTMARRLAKEGYRCVIVTGDKDMLQLVDDRVKVLNPQKDYVVYDSDEVEKRFGVKPRQVPDVLSLMGDSSDYIPGVPGIGEKTALELVRAYGDLDGVLAHLAEIPQAARRKALEENRADAVLSRELAVIDCAVPMDFAAEDLALKGPDAKALRGLYEELEFRSLLQGLPPDEGPKHPKRYRLVVDAAAFADLARELARAGEFAFDFETTGLDPLTAEPVGVSFSWKPHEAVFVLFRTHRSGTSALDPAESLGRLKPLFEDARVRKVGQNLKYEMAVLKRLGIALKGVAFDTMIGSYLLNSSKRNHNLGVIALEVLRERLIPIEDLIGKGKDQITMADADLERLVEYGCQDSDVAWRLAGILRPQVEEKGMRELCDRIELPLIEVLCDMETAGIAFDRAVLEKSSREMAASLERLEKEIYSAAGSEFNVNSPRQLGEVLFVKLGLPVLRRTKTGPSTDSEVLTELAESHDLPRLVLEYRELAKLKSTYVDTMPQMANPATGRIHSSFNQTVTETGRLSSNDPNLQNIPVRTEEGRKIRRAFVAPPGFRLLAADYSQIELRVLAHLSGDAGLVRAFREGKDIHAYTAGLIFGVEPADVSPKMRETAKTVNFGILYGMSAFGLAKSLRISQEAARDFIRAYFERYPGVKAFLDRTIESARERGYVETLWKRRRYIPDIKSSDPRIRQYAERTATNAPVQGTASDLIKLAMIAVHGDLAGLGFGARLVLQVHDELIFEVEERGTEELGRVVKRHMEGAAKLDVPIEVTLKAGPNWRDMEKLTLR